MTMFVILTTFYVPCSIKRNTFTFSFSFSNLKRTTLRLSISRWSKFFCTKSIFYRFNTTILSSNVSTMIYIFTSWTISDIISQRIFKLMSFWTFKFATSIPFISFSKKSFWMRTLQNTIFRFKPIFYTIISTAILLLKIGSPLNLFSFSI